MDSLPKNPGTRLKGTKQGAHWEMDFNGGQTRNPLGDGFQWRSNQEPTGRWTSQRSNQEPTGPWILQKSNLVSMVFLDIFSGCMEAFPTRHETSKTVTKNFLEDIIPRYGILIFLSSEDGPAFISQITQLLVRALRENWKLHCAYRPESSWTEP